MTTRTRMKWKLESEERSAAGTGQINYNALSKSTNRDRVIPAPGEIKTAANSCVTRRKKVLKPPGAAARRPPPVRPRSAAKPAPASDFSPNTQRALKAARAADAAEAFKAPQLRKSTRQRVEDAERERERNEQVGG